jgi:5-enolpyruvylshikimate-3-phosphate synthase
MSHRRPGLAYRAAEFDSLGDHRIAMTFAVAVLRAEGEIAAQQLKANG